MRKMIPALRLMLLLLALTALLCACRPAAPATEPPAQNAHWDENKDEICDDCGIDVTVELNFYALNDLHGVFLDTGTNPGVDELTTYLKNAYADDAGYEILLSSGDMWQGSVESSTNKGQLMTQWLNEVGLVAMTLGNHEYDWGSSYIAENALLADFPFLGINVTDSNVQEPYCQSSVVVERGGVKIGIIGAVGDVLSSISGEFTGGLSIAVEQELTRLVKQEATRLRQEEGCHFIVYSIHDGYSKSTNGTQTTSTSLSYYDLELSEGYVDLVFEGHSHKSYILKDRHGVYHLQGGGYNSGLSFASVTYNLATNTYEVLETEILGHEDYADPALPDDPIVEQLKDRFLGNEDYYGILGRSDVRRSSEEIAQTVAQLYLEKGRQLWGGEYDIVLGGGYIKTRPPYDLPAGNVTYAQLFSLLTFDNDLVLCSIKGRDLRERFLDSDYAVACDSSLAGSISDDGTYYIVVDSYTSVYAPNRLTEVARMKGLYARDLLKEFVASGGWGTVPQAITISRANEIGAALQAGETTGQAYELTGVVSTVENTTYGNLYIRDEAGNTFYIYGLYDYSGQIRYDAMDRPPQAGDTITVIGAITKYVGYQGTIIEMQSACLK